MRQGADRGSFSGGGNEAVVSFTVASPVIQTRAVADGNTVDKVACCVYNEKGELIEGTPENAISQTIAMTGGKATFSVRLVTGQTYSFLFWAYKSIGGDGDGKDGSAYYTLDRANKKVTVSYENASSNDESRDAFYRYIASKTITGAVNEKVELHRPFAQLNFGVEIADIVAAKAADAGLTVDNSRVKVVGLGNVLKLEDGTVEVEGGDDGGVTAEFALAALPAGTLPTAVSDTGEYASGILEVGGKKYGHVAMNYVLPYGNVNTELTVANGTTEINTISVTNVPLKTNYRTNVVGNLFTSEVVENIIVVPEFTEPDIVQEFVSITAEKIADANALIANNKAADIIEVKFAAAPEDVTSKAILTTPIKEDGTLNVEISNSVGTLYVGNYTSESYSAETPLVENNSAANKAVVNITIPENVTIEELVICDDTKTVNINGVNAKDYQAGGQIKKLTAKTSMNTLVIAKGQVIGTLVFQQGGLEIHGTVNEVQIDKKGDIEVRECENLNSNVYGVLKTYIKTGYVGVKGLSTADLYDIVCAQNLSYENYRALKGSLPKGYYGVKNTDGTWNIEYEACPYLTFSADSEKKFKMQFWGNTRTYLKGVLEYSVGGGEWTVVEHGINVNFGGTFGSLMLRGKADGTQKVDDIAAGFVGTAYDPSDYAQIVLTFNSTIVPVTVTGDIRTLIDYENFETVDTQGAKFIGLFKNNKSIVSAPELPATTLAERCYQEMFKDCISLTEAPTLPATTLAKRCYQGMFSGCKALSSVTVKAESLGEDSLIEWLKNVASTGTVYKNFNLALEANSVSGIPSGWSTADIAE